MNIKNQSTPIHLWSTALQTNFKGVNMKALFILLLLSITPLVTHASEKIILDCKLTWLDADVDWTTEEIRHIENIFVLDLDNSVATIPSLSEKYEIEEISDELIVIDAWPVTFKLSRVTGEMEYFTPNSKGGDSPLATTACTRKKNQF